MEYLKYLFFRLFAKNAHGVHSPFVYDFVTQCLNKKSEESEITAVAQHRARVEANLVPKKFDLMLLRVFKYFNFKSIVQIIDGKKEDLCFKSLFGTSLSDDAFDSVKWDGKKELNKCLNNNRLLIVDASLFKMFSKSYFHYLIENIAENDVLLVKKAHSKMSDNGFLASLISSQNIHLSIDLYYYTLFFKRSKQRKEHFKLKF